MKTCKADLLSKQLEDEKSVKISAMFRLFSTYWSQILVGCSREICLQLTGHSLKPLSFVGESGCPQLLAAYASLFLLVHAQYCSSCINVYYYMHDVHPGWMNPDYQLVLVLSPINKLGINQSWLDCHIYTYIYIHIYIYINIYIYVYIYVYMYVCTVYIIYICTVYIYVQYNIYIYICTV